MDEPRDLNRTDSRDALDARTVVAYRKGSTTAGVEGRLVRAPGPPDFSPEPARFWQGPVFVIREESRSHTSRFFEGS